MHVNPVFASTLAAFGGQAAPPAKPHKILVAIEPFEVQVTTRAANRSGPVEWAYVRPSDEMIRAAAAHVLGKHADEVEAAVIRLVNGETLS